MEVACWINATQNCGDPCRSTYTGSFRSSSLRRSIPDQFKRHRYFRDVKLFILIFRKNVFVF